MPLKLLIRFCAGERACRVAGGRGGVGVVQLQAGDPQVHRQRAEQRGHAGQREAVLPPGDPGHPPPRHRPQARVLLRAGGHGQRGHLVTSDGSASRPRAGPGSAAAPGSRR